MRPISGVVGLLATAFISSQSLAFGPSPVTSTVPTCLLVCPQGDIADTVVSRDIAGNPQSMVQVVLDFSECVGISLCPAQATTPYTILSPSQVQVMTDNSGQAIFALQVKGTCSGGVKIFADGRVLTDGSFHLMPLLINVDQDGDGIVTTADQTILAARGSADPLGDLNCDGVHNATDISIFATHLGHQCPSFAVPVRGTTWGAVKIHYR